PASPLLLSRRSDSQADVLARNPGSHVRLRCLPPLTLHFPDVQLRGVWIARRRERSSHSDPSWKRVVMVMNILFLAVDVDLRRNRGDSIHVQELTDHLVGLGHHVVLVTSTPDHAVSTGIVNATAPASTPGQ